MSRTEYHVVTQCDCGNTTNVHILSLLRKDNRAQKSCGLCKYAKRRGNNHPLWKGCGRMPHKFWLRIVSNANTREIPVYMTQE